MQRSGCLTSRRLREVPGVGPVIATAKPAFFDCARSFSAWLGITPRQHSSGGKERTFGITKRGNTYLRRQLIIGARAVVRVARGRKGGMWDWINKMLDRFKFRCLMVSRAGPISLSLPRCFQAAVLSTLVGMKFLGVIEFVGVEPPQGCRRGFSGPFGALPPPDPGCNETQ